MFQQNGSVCLELESRGSLHIQSPEFDTLDDLVEYFTTERPGVPFVLLDDNPMFVASRARMGPGSYDQQLLAMQHMSNV